jgi:hypothetical protein
LFSFPFSVAALSICMIKLSIDTLLVASPCLTQGLLSSILRALRGAIAMTAIATTA